MRLVAEDIDNMGHPRVVVKGDSEPAMTALVGKVKVLQSHPAILEESPDYEPQSNRLALRFVPSMNGLCRTTRGVLDPDDHLNYVAYTAHGMPPQPAPSRAGCSHVVGTSRGDIFMHLHSRAWGEGPFT